MNYNPYSQSVPAPCIIDNGLIVNKDDIRRLLTSIGWVRYIHTLDGLVQSQGEGCILEVFNDSCQGTLVANHSLFINVQSFDYLHIQQRPNAETFFDLVQDNRQLRLIPLSNPLKEQETGHQFDEATLEAMLTQVLSAKWDVQFDDDLPY